MEIKSFHIGFLKKFSRSNCYQVGSSYKSSGKESYDEQDYKHYIRLSKHDQPSAIQYWKSDICNVNCKFDENDIYHYQKQINFIVLKLYYP